MAFAINGKSSKLLLIKEQFNRVQHRSAVCQDLWPYMLFPWEGRWF